MRFELVSLSSPSRSISPLSLGPLRQGALTRRDALSSMTHRSRGSRAHAAARGEGRREGESHFRIGRVTRLGTSGAKEERETLVATQKISERERKKKKNETAFPPRPRSTRSLPLRGSRRPHQETKRAMPPPPGTGSKFRARALVRSGARIPPLRRPSTIISSSLASSSSSRALNLPASSSRLAMSRVVPIGTFAAGAAALGGMALASGVSRWGGSCGGDDFVF